MTAVYLAATYGRKLEMRGYRDQLESLGYEVTSRWIDQEEHDQEGNTIGDGLGTDELNDQPSLGIPFALKDVEDVRKADWVVSFTPGPGRGGRHVEFGMAFALDKFLIIVGPREHVFHCLPGIDWYPDFPALVNNLEKFR